MNQEKVGQRWKDHNTVCTGISSEFYSEAWPLFRRSIKRLKATSQDNQWFWYNMQSWVMFVTSCSTGNIDYEFMILLFKDGTLIYAHYNAES